MTLSMRLLAVPLLGCMAAGAGKCTDDQWKTFCPKLCGDGLGQGNKMWDSCYKTCYAHSIITKNDWGADQGAYMQTDMLHYCDNGLCGASLLAKGSRQVKRHGWGGSQGGMWGGSQGGMWGGSSGGMWGGSQGGSKGGKGGCKSSQGYCKQMCSDLRHPISKWTSLGGHPGTENCPSESNCPPRDKCIQDCNAHWATGMKGVYDDFCTCVKENGRPKLPSLLETGAEHPEEVDVGSFMQVQEEL